MTQTAPGKLGTGPGGPAGPPYGRTEYGRSRRRAHAIPGTGKGLKPYAEAESRAAFFLTCQLSHESWLDMFLTHRVAVQSRPRRKW